MLPVFAQFEMGGGEEVRMVEFGLRSVGSSLRLDGIGAQRRRYTFRLGWGFSGAGYCFSCHLPLVTCHSF
jgi:hypothetical protein